MKVNYNIQKEERKAMVAVVSKVLDTKPVYCRRTDIFLQDRRIRDCEGRQPLLRRCP